MSIEEMLAGKTLQLGSQGDDVRDVQLALVKLGFKLKGTGYFGGATDTSVQSFQNAKGLPQTGVVDIITARALDAAKPLQSVDVSVPLWVQEAKKWAGLHEGVGAADNPKIIEWAKAEGGNIAKSYTHDSIAWCALFVNMVFTKVGIKGTETLWALDWAGKWPSIKLGGPAVGAVCPMTREGGGHVMILLGRDKAGNYVGIGGNQGDAVNIRSFPAQRLNKGFWWPKGVSLPLAIGMSVLPLIRADGTSGKEN